MAFAFLVNNAHAQTISLPAVSSLKTSADLDRTKDNLIEAANWLAQTPLNTHKEKRKDVERFVFMWISASKKVNVHMNEKILRLDEKNPGFVMIYTAAAARHIVESARSSGASAQSEGLKTVANVYSRNIGVKKDKLVDELVKAIKKNRVLYWVNN